MDALLTKRFVNANEKFRQLRGATAVALRPFAP
jgi:hypothetical protein